MIFLATACVFLSGYIVVKLILGHLSGGRLTKMAGPRDDSRSRGVKRRAMWRAAPYSRERLEEQMECLSVLVAGAMATGQTLIQALESCAIEIPDDPLGSEIRRVVDAYRVGTPVLTGLISMAGRLGHPDADYLVRVIEIHLMSGGDLGNALSNVASTVRRRRSLRWEIRAGCADARLSAAIMAACPPVLAAFTAGVRPEMLRALLGAPLGRIGLAYGFVSWILGLYLSARVTKVDNG